jgi:hypothetical protein
MQNPVRFYITQNEDQPVVRTIPVVPRAVDDVPTLIVADANQVNETTPARPKRVSNLVRAAVKRTNGSAK